MKSIQTKLTVAILLIFLVSLSVLGGLNYWKAREIISQSIINDLTDSVAKSAGDIGDWLDGRRSEMAIMSVAPVIQSGNLEALAPFLNNASKENKEYDAICYADQNGNFLNSTGAKGSIADREYFQKAIKGEANISNPVISKSTGHLVAPVAVPIKKDGKVTGVMYGTVTLDSLTKKLQDIKVGQTGYAYVIQDDGLAIIHPDKELAMKVNLFKDEKIPQVLRSVSERMIKGETGLARYEYGGVDKLVAFAPVPGTKWSLAITVPTDELTGQVRALTMISIGTIVVVLLLAGLFIAWYARRIAGPIQRLEEAAQRIAAGDITTTKLDINSDDEIGRLGQSFEQMGGNLRSLIRKILSATEQVAASSEQLTASSEQSAQAANQIASSITDVAAGAHEQMEAASQTSAVVEQMSANIRQLASNANQVAAQTAEAAGKAKDGERAVETAVAQMDQIEETVTSSAEVVAKLGERSKEIGQIVDTIAGIAGQTNLLALNAAIEAARAGEQGRGFAVVAEEVRKLAEQSQEAAGKIAELIGEIQADTDKAVVAMNDGTREVKTGAEVVSAAGGAFREIVGLVTQVSGQVKDISSAMQQMAAGSEQINGSFSKINELSQKSAGEAQGVSAAAEEQLASMEEVASSSQSLAKLAQDLQSAVAGFRV